MNIGILTPAGPVPSIDQPVPLSGIVRTLSEVQACLSPGDDAPMRQRIHAVGFQMALAALAAVLESEGDQFFLFPKGTDRAIRLETHGAMS